MFHSSLSNTGEYQTIRAGILEIPLAEFLSYCATGDASCITTEVDNNTLKLLRQRFVSGGLNALESDSNSSCWIQFGLVFGSGTLGGEVYHRLAMIARDLLSVSRVSNFFFMHKPPGMRVRFETGAKEAKALKQDLSEQLYELKNDELIERIEPGIYEPETYLFGGPASMRYVHELFTVDSLAWLDYHALSLGPGSDAGPAWALSLLNLQATFAALRITDWEDLDVWDRVRRRTGRNLPETILPGPEFGEIAADLQARWINPEILISELSDPVRSIADAYREVAPQIASRWYDNYFATAEASIGSRGAAALLTIFHWNRANISLPRQALIAESLVTRETV